MRLSLRGRLVALCVAACALPVAAIWLLVATSGPRVLRDADAELGKLGRQNVTDVARGVHRLCKTTNGLMQPRLDLGLQAAREAVARAGGFALEAGRQRWTAVDQETGRATTVELPALSLGGKRVLENADTKVPSPVVDDVKGATGLYASVFQVMNDRGDMLRVVSSVVTPEGRRGVGLFLPAVFPDGTPSPAIQAVREGRVHRGMSLVAGRMYLALYAPLTDPSRKVIGMLAVAFDTEILDQLRQTIRETRVGKTGEITVVGAHGRQRGVCLVSRGGEREGESVWETRDAGGRPVVQAQLEEVLSRPAGEVVVDRFAMRDSGERIAALVYFEPWDWLVAAETSEQDFLAPRRRLRAALDRLLVTVGWGGALLVAVVSALASVLALGLARPLSLLASSAKRVGDGDLRGIAGSSARPGERDETRIVAGAFARMGLAVSSLVSDIQGAGVQVTTAATGTASSARELEAAVGAQDAATGQLSAGARQILGRTEALLSAIDSVASAASTIARDAAEGQRGLTRMDDGIRRLGAATSSVSDRLSGISERASAIGVLVTTIAEVAAETNLLSLNASIEAEKAGEAGRGFAVVAREIRRVADETSGASGEIERAVRALHASVSSGVMEMDRFVDEVRRASADVETVSQRLASVAEDVRALEPRVEEVRSGTHAQREGAGEIARAASALEASAASTRDSLHEFQAATSQLSHAVSTLREGIATLKVA